MIWKLLGEPNLEGVLSKADALPSARVYRELREQGAIVLLTAKAKQKPLYRQIAKQMCGKRYILYVAADH